MMMIFKEFINYFSKRQFVLLFMTFSNPYMVEKALFRDPIFEIAILMHLYAFMFSKYENHIYGGWFLSLPVYLLSA